MANKRARVDPEHGPLIRVVLRPAANRPHVDPIDGWALLDTGAKRSGVHAPLASHALGWQIIGAVELYTPGTTSEAVPVYEGSFSFEAEGKPLDMELVGLALGYKAADAQVIMILGRDFLEGKVLGYDGRKGEWTMHW